MVQLQLRLRARAGCAHEMAQALRLIMRAAQTGPGFERANLYSETGNEELLCYEENWATVADMDRQILSDRFTQILAVIETAVEPPSLEFRFVDRKRGLDYVEAVRRGEPPK